MRETSIIILTYNNLKYNKGVLESIKKNTKKDTYEVIIVDNASTDGTREWLQEQQGIKVILNDENIGFPKGCNIGITYANLENDILLLNNDIEVTHNWLENLQIALHSDPKVGAVQGLDAHHFHGMFNENGDPIDFNADDTSEIHIFATQNNVSNSNRWKYVNFLAGYCFLIKRHVLDQIGLLDERFSPGNFEDDDLSYRTLAAGYYLLRCHDCFIQHFGSKSFRNDEISYWKLIDTNAKKFIEKWGFHAWDKKHQQNNLLRLLEADETNPIHVLQIGSRLGSTLFDVKNKYPFAHLYGIETNENYGAVMKGIINLSTKPATEFPLEFEKQLFDFILFGENFEQVGDPHEFLVKIKEYLKPNGQIIFNIKNIMHASVLENLLNGHWHYTDTILKKDDYTFLTAADIERLSKECGYYNTLIFHWYSQAADESFIKSLCAITDEGKSYLYRTYLYTVRLQKPMIAKTNLNYNVK